jgi:hypothetical protein
MQAGSIVAYYLERLWEKSGSVVTSDNRAEWRVIEEELNDLEGRVASLEETRRIAVEVDR